MDDMVKILRAKKAAALLGGGQERINKHHEKGRLTVRERVDKLLDPGSFIEQHTLSGEYKDTKAGIYGDGIVTGFGKIDGRRVSVYSQDATVHGGSTGPMHRGKMCELMDDALRYRLPLIGLHDGAGGRLEIPGEAIEIGFGRPSVFTCYTRASGVIPQITVILGPCTGNAVYGPALTDFIFVIDGVSYMFITGPRSVKEVMSEEVTMEQLGSAKIHAEVSGVADFRVKNEEECFQQIRKLLSFLPSNNMEQPPIVSTGDSPDRMDYDIADVIPADHRKPYDMNYIIRRVVDNGDFFAVKAGFARNMIVGFGRLNGRTVGFVANQPMVYAGALTYDSSDKEARFIRFCDAFNIPIVFLADTPGYMPGTVQEQAGIIRHGAKVLHAISEAVVPKITVLIRKNYGGGRIGMGADKDMGIDQVYAWPCYEGSTMGADASVEILYRKEIDEAENPAEYRAKKVQEFSQMYCNPYGQAASGTIDDVIEPWETRPRLIKALEIRADKTEVRLPKKHGNIPM